MIGLNHLKDNQHLIVDIAQVRRGVNGKTFMMFARKVPNKLSHGPRNSSDHQQVSLDLVNGLERRAVQLRQHILLEPLTCPA